MIGLEVGPDVPATERFVCTQIPPGIASRAHQSLSSGRLDDLNGVGVVCDMLGDSQPEGIRRAICEIRETPTVE